MNRLSELDTEISVEVNKSEGWWHKEIYLRMGTFTGFFP